MDSAAIMANGSLTIKLVGKTWEGTLPFFLCLLFLTLPLSFVLAQQPLKKQLAMEVRLMEADRDAHKDTVYINLLNKLGYQLLYTNRDSVQLLSQRALEVSREIGHKYGEAHSLINLGSNEIFMGNVAGGLTNADLSIKIAKEIPDNDLMLKALNLKGICFFYDGRYIEAYKIYMEGIGIAKEEGDRHNEFKISMNLGTLFSILKDHDNALKYYDKALVLAEGLKDEIGLARTRSNLGYLHSNTGEFQNAIPHIDSAIVTFEKKGIMEWLAFSYLTKAEIFLKQNAYQEALEYFQRSFKIHGTLQDKKGKTDVLLGLAEAYYGLDQTDISLTLAQESLDIAQDIKFISGLERSSNLLYKIYKKKKEHVKALHYLEVARKISDSLSINDKKVSLMMFGAKTEFEETQRKLNTSNQNALNTQKRYIYLSLFALLGLTIVIILLRRTTVIEKKFNRELQHRELELTAINDTKNKLFSIIGHDLKGPVNNLNQLLKLYVDKQIGEEEFAQFAPKLQKDVDNIHFTLNNLLSWGKTQMQGATIDPKEVVVHRLVHENCMLLNDMAVNKNLEIRNEIPKEAVVWADPHHVDIILRNLIGNAIKFTPQQGLIILTAKEEGEYLTIEIKDNGVGMDPETQHKILNGKGAYSTYGTNNEKGTGLGLSLCRELLKKNRGKISVKSSPEKGSTFSLSLPKKKGVDKI